MATALFKGLRLIIVQAVACGAFIYFNGRLAA